MNLTDMITRLRIELKDAGALWSDSELSRAVNKATVDVDRHFPLDASYEHTVVQTVTGEHWTASGVAGGFVELANKPIKYNSETVTDSDDTACTRDTDYTMDYINGRIAHIAGKEIGSGEADCHISYKKDTIAIDLSALNIIRIQRVEYPYGDTPQSFASYDFFDDKLIITGAETDAQARLTDGKHIIVYYLTSNVIATSLADGSFPRHLDEIVIKGAAGYACFIKAIEYEHQAATDFLASRSVLSTLAAIHILTDKALDDAKEQLTVISHTAFANALSAAEGQLTSISHTAFTNALAAAVIALQAATSIIGGATTYLTSDTAPSAKKYLDDGDALINDVNVGGQNVAPTYAVFAQRCADLAMGLINTATMHNTVAGSYIGEANAQLGEMDRYLASGNSYLSEANGLLGEMDRYLSAANAFLGEANGRIAEMNIHLAHAAQLASLGSQNLVLADRWRVEATERRNEFWSILRERAELRGRTVATTSVRQVRT